MKQIIILTLCLIAPYANAQWSNDCSTNNAISVEVNNQQEPRIVKDNKGGAIICWTDFRGDTLNKTGDIFLQRIKKSGAIAWTLNGISVCNQLADQTEPFIIEDGSGGAIITWQDLRNGTRDIYAQRIDSNGTSVWSLNGIAVAQKASQQRSPRIISDGNKGAIIVWEDSINGASDIYIQKVNANGTLAWNSNGIAVCSNIGVQINARLCSDNSGGAIITWQDKRNGNDYDIYAQKVSTSGVASWTTGGVPVCVRTNTQSNPKIEMDNTGGAYIIWQDKRGAIDFDVYAQRINSAGVAQWTANGNLVCNASGSQSAIDAVTENISNGVIITWKDGRTTNNHIYAQMVNSLGNNLWANNGISLSNSSYPQLNPNIVSVAANEAVVTWQDSLSGAWDCYAQKINTSGTALWANSGVCISSAIGNQTGPKNVSNGSGGSIFAFQDKRNGNFDIYAFQIKSNGTPTAVENIDNNENLVIFPNPSNGVFYINSDEEFYQSLSIQIYNSIGEIVFNTKINAGSKMLQLIPNYLMEFTA